MSARNTARRSTPIRRSSGAPPRPRASAIRRGSPPPATARSRPRSATRRNSTSPRTTTSNIWRRTRSAIAGSAAPACRARWRRGRRHRGPRLTRGVRDPLTAIYVDGDACPVREEVYRVAARLGLEVFVVSNFSRPLRPPGLPNVRMVIVGEEADAADDWIAEHVAAQRCLRHQRHSACLALSREGRPGACPERTGMERGQYRRRARRARGRASSARAGRATPGPPPLTRRHDRSRFLSALDTEIRRALRRRGRPSDPARLTGPCAKSVIGFG